MKLCIIIFNNSKQNAAQPAGPKRTGCRTSIKTLKEEQMVFEKIREIIADQLDTEPEEITLETDLMKDLEADSLDAVEIIMAIENEFNIEVPDDKAEEFKLVENIVSFVEERI